MKRITSTALATVAAAVVVGGFTTPAYASSQADCSSSKPASVYTDGLQHFAGVCAGGKYIQVNELALLATGVVPVEVGTGVAPVDQTFSGLTTVPLAPASVQCTATYGSALVIYTDALAHVLGACDPYGNNVQVNEIAGALVARNNLVSAQTQLFTATVQTQATDGGPGVVLHPKIVVTPHS